MGALLHAGREVYENDIAEAAVLIPLDDIDPAALQGCHQKILVGLVHGDEYRILAVHGIHGIHVLQSMIRKNAVAGDLGEITMYRIEIVLCQIHTLIGRVLQGLQCLQLLPLSALLIDLKGAKSLSPGLAVLCGSAAYIRVQHSFFSFT